MTQKKEIRDEEFVFEFYDEDYSKSLEDIIFFLNVIAYFFYLI